VTSSSVRPLAALVALAILVMTSVSGCGSAGGGGTNYSAMFTTAIGVYPNADVRVLGVPVGKVDKVTPEGPLVRVDFHVDGDVQVPADAKAAVVAPTVVADRYLQLAPVYTGGPTLAEGTVIPKERTASPAEFDDLLASAQKLSKSLGPEGVNANGALSQALTTAAQNLKGNGQQLNITLDNTSQAINTLSASRDNLANTTKNLQSFTTNIKQDDSQVRAFTEQFAQVNGFLAGERQDLGETLKELSQALGDVAKFVHDNRSGIRENVNQLSDVLENINNERLALEQVLETAPAGLDGLVNAYDAGVASLDTRSDLLGTTLCLLETNLGPLGPLLFKPAVDIAFPGLIDAACPPMAMMLGASMSPALKAQLSDPKVIAALTEAMRRRSAALPKTVTPPKATFPLVAPAPAASSGGDKPPLPAAPEDPKKTIGNLLGGGR
jgi:virulence factor Mce-like protein